jgi:hypothetical protein
MSLITVALTRDTVRTAAVTSVSEFLVASFRSCIHNYWARVSVVGWGNKPEGSGLDSRIRHWILFKWRNPSSRIMALRSTEPLTEISIGRTADFGRWICCAVVKTQVGEPFAAKWGSMQDHCIHDWLLGPLIFCLSVRQCHVESNDILYFN